MSTASSSTLPSVFVYTFLTGRHVPRNVICVRVDSSVKAIVDRAFESCRQLQEVELHDELLHLGRNTFTFCSFQNFRVPRSVTKIDDRTFSHCRKLFSVEVPKSLKRIENYSFFSCNCLRNIAIPPTCNTSKYMFGIASKGVWYKTDLVNLFPSYVFRSIDKAIIKMLKHRFDGLPIHEICYYHSYRPTEEVLQDLNMAANSRRTWQLPRLHSRPAVSDRSQDSLGMTPLHILACSTKHDLELYRWIIEHSPQSLITKDKWGDVPILYALWGDAPQEVVHLLAKSQTSLFPDQVLDWEGMVRLLFNAGAHLVCFDNLFKAHHTWFSDHHADWQEVVTQLAEYVSRLNTHRTGEAIRQNMVETIKHLLKRSIRKRLDSLGKRKWREEIEKDIYEFTLHKVWVHRWVNILYTKLASYEELKEMTTLLELAVWKTRIVQPEKDKNGQYVTHINDSICRQRCRVNCGAEAILPNVLPFLLPKKVPLFCIMFAGFY